MTKAEAIERYALDAVGSAYIYGATGKPCTPALRRAQAKQYPNSAEMIEKYCQALNKNKGCDGCKYAGRNAYDCAQLVRCAARAAGISMVSGATSQWKKTDWLSMGEYDQRPKGQLVIAFRMAGKASSLMQHVGIELTDGSCIHAKGHAYGVVHDKPGAYQWSHYGVLPGMTLEVDQVAEIVKKAPQIVAGMKAIVAAGSGSTVNLRKNPNGELIAPVPVGSEAKVLETTGDWSRVRVEVDGWMMTKFLKEGET